MKYVYINESIWFIKSVWSIIGFQLLSAPCQTPLFLLGFLMTTETFDPVYAPYSFWLFTCLFQEGKY